VTVVIAAAGTGGHVYPALAVAARLRSMGVPASRIAFLGGDRLEAQVVPAEGYRFTGFPLARLRRSASLSNLGIPGTVRRSARGMTTELEDVGARVVLGMGGYVVVPAVIAARRVGVPFLLQEQNASPGLASRFAARSAQRVFLGLPGRGERLARAEVVGNPLRPALEEFDRGALRSPARDRYGIGTPGPVVGVLGGSLGARALNEAVSALAERLAGATVLHLTGPAAAHQAAVHPADGGRRITRSFEDSMEFFYAAVDLVVCRSGAMTVSELAATATPSVLVPLRRGGQRSNAAVLSSIGAAVVVEQEGIGAVGDIVKRIVDDREVLEKMSRAAGTAALAGAAGYIARAVMDAADA
jgi:UDP-N-acetylglucosamine--N-acetylmuramyl-(pentapeptide) pyrophosphoryl-undecaprenol N-acetylglucosamine transferase